MLNSQELEFSVQSAGEQQSPSPTLLSPAAPHISTDDGHLMLMVEHGIKVNLLLSVINGGGIKIEPKNIIIQGDNGEIKVPHIITFTDQVEKDLALFKRRLTEDPDEYEDLVLGVVSFRTLLKAEEGSSHSSFLLSLPQFTTRAFQNLLRIVVLYNSDDDENQGNRDLIIRKLSFLSSAAGNKREEEVKDRVVFMQMKDYCEEDYLTDKQMHDNCTKCRLDNWAKCQRLLQPFLTEASEHNNGKNRIVQSQVLSSVRVRTEASEHNNGKNRIVHSPVLSSVGIYSFYLFGHNRGWIWLCVLLTLLVLALLNVCYIQHVNALQLASKLDASKNALNVSLNELTNLSDTAKALETGNANLSDTLTFKEKENASLTALLEVKEKEITSLSDTVKTKDKEITSLSDRLTSKDKENASLTALLEAKEKEIASATKENTLQVCTPGTKGYERCYYSKMVAPTVFDLLSKAKW